MKIILKQKYCSQKPQSVDEEPCELYDSCADIMTPKEAMLKMLATGQKVDIDRRQAFYDSEEMEDYIEAEYPCDYITAYKEYMDEVRRPRKHPQSKQSSPLPKAQTQDPPNTQDPSQSEIADK